MSLDELAAKIEGANSLRARLLLVAKHWPELRKLPRAQRENIAIGMGSRWAGRRVMRLMEADGKLTEGERLAKSVLDQFATEDPHELRRLARELREGNLDGVEDAFVGALGSAVDQRAAETTERAPQGPPPLPIEIEAVSAPTAKVNADPIDELTTVLAAIAATKELAERAEPVADAVTVAAKPAAEVEATPSSAPAPAPKPEPKAQDALALTETGLAEPPSASAQDRWRLRRSVSARIRKLEYPSVDSALEAVAQLKRADSKWCLGDLVEHWPLDSEALAKVLSASPDDRTKARLAARAKRQRPELSPALQSVRG